MQELLILTSLSEEEDAMDFIEELLEAELIKSGFIMPGKTMYLWEGQLTIDEEYKLMLKTSEEFYARIEEFIQDKHPYLIPEIVKVSYKPGSEQFWEFVQGKIKKANSQG